MTTTVAAVTFDCDDALQLAEFWSAVLDRPIDRAEPAASEFFARITAGDDSAEAPTLMFIKVPEAKTTKNRVHLDLASGNRAAEVERLLALGATHIHDKAEWGIEWTTLADPEGNEFCIGQH